MSGQVVHLPRPEMRRLGLYLRVGHNQHKDMLGLLAEGISDFFGVIIDASCAVRHKELIAEALKRNLDVVLDPQTQKAATIGGFTSSIGDLPWGLDHPNRLEDFELFQGRKRAAQIAEFAQTYGFTQILGPTHILQSPNDPWLRRDIAMMGYLQEALGGQESEISLLYSLALPIQILRDRVQRRALVAAVADAPFDALWLRIENFGSDATGEKTAAYIEACTDFQTLGVPIVADHVGGLPGLGLMAFSAVGGIAHGITMLEGFRPAPWRNPRKSKQGGGSPVRVYFPKLDLLLKPIDAAALLKSNSRLQGRFGCLDTHCCPKGVPDMLQHPSRHFVYQRSRQVKEISAAPEAVRIQTYLDNEVRRVSDDVAATTGFKSLNATLKKNLTEKQKKMGRFRQAMAHLAEVNPIEEPTKAPLDRQTRESNRRK